jgi:YHS domain-containing protein
MRAMMRQIGKQILTIAVLLMAMGAPQALQAASVITAIVTDPLTGVAIEGYDPVSYFTEAEPQQGLPDYEFIWGGVPWYFANAANRDVFMRAPEVYAPRFGGHCTMSLARGYLSDGKPAIYAVRDGHLHLFYSAANREAFLMTSGTAMTDAETNWVELAKTLTHE